MALSISWRAGLDSLFFARSLPILGPSVLIGDFSSLPVVWGGSVLHIIGAVFETFPGQLYVFGVYWCPHQETNQKLRMDVHTSFHKSIHQFINNSGRLGAVRTLMRVIGSIWIHLLCVSWHSLARAILKVWLALSTFPKTWGHQDEWKRYLIPKHAARFWDIAAVNEGLLSLWSYWGSPNLGTMSLSRALQAFVPLSALVGNASIHLVNGK